MLSKNFTYEAAGVDRKLRAESKKALNYLKETYNFSHYGDIVELPYGKIFPFRDGYLDLVIEGVGTKVLVAQLANKYDTIGIDGVAVAVNDVIRSGARPLAVADNIHAQVSEPVLVEQWMKGIAKGAAEAECVVPSGEIGDVDELIRGLVQGKGFDMVFASVGEVSQENVIYGREIEPGDAIIGLRSSGIHSNGISLARKILFKEWGGKYEAHEAKDELERELVLEVLEPTKIYVKSVRAVARDVQIKAAVHITGDGYLKFYRLIEFSKGIGFEFNVFDPQPIFALIQKTGKDLGGKIADEEMFKTFNMGWGFALVVDKKDKEDVLTILEKADGKAEQIGRITNTGKVKIHYRHKRMILA